MKLFIKLIFACKLFKSGKGKISNVKMFIQKRQTRISFLYWSDEKSGNPEKVRRMASLNTISTFIDQVTIQISLKKNNKKKGGEEDYPSK